MAELIFYGEIQHKYMRPKLESAVKPILHNAPQ